MKRRLLVVIPLALVIAAVAAVLARSEKRPPECTLSAAPPEASIKSGLAITSSKRAVDLVTRALAAADAQDKRLSFLRRYDVKLCKDAGDALAAAALAAQQAGVTRDKVKAMLDDGQKAVDEMKAHVDGAVAWTNAGVVGDAVVQRASALRAAADEASGLLVRARTEMETSGYEAPFSVVDHALDAVRARGQEAAALSVEARAAGLARCPAKVKGKAIDVVTQGDLGPRVFRDWLVLHGRDDASREHVLFYALDRDSKRCVFLHAEPGVAKEDLFEWNIPGTIPAKVLVGWGKARSFFLGRDGAWRSFTHLAKQKKCKLTDAGCDKPSFTVDAAEGRCACVEDGLELSRVAHYSWDGHFVIQED
jgi:hypothetical protein